MPKETKNSRATIGYRIGVMVVGLLVVACAVFIPIGLRNLWSVVRNANEESYTLFHVPPTSGTYSLVHIEVITLDETQQLITLRVTGYHACDQRCDYQENIAFFSLASAMQPADGLPIAETLKLPTTATEQSMTFQLPLKSSLIRYPFDTNQLILGITVEQIGLDGSALPLTPADAMKQLDLGIANQIPRVSLRPPSVIDAARLRPVRVKNFDYLAVYSLTFERYLYLKILVVLIVMLVATAAAYVAFLHPFDNQLLINVGAVVLGIYGVRSLVLGTFPPDTTAVDIALTSVAFFLLCTVAVRGLNYMHLKSGLAIPGLAREKPKEETTRVCPECGSSIPNTARRCPFCTSLVEPKVIEQRTKEEIPEAGETDSV